jgi:hypothetical protein
MQSSLDMERASLLPLFPEKSTTECVADGNPFRATERECRGCSFGETSSFHSLGLSGVMGLSYSERPFEAHSEVLGGECS